MTDSLLSRLQALTEPSREIDAEIALANGWKQLSHDLWIDDGCQCHTAPPRYTEIINDALRLVPVVDAPRTGLWINLHTTLGSYGTPSCAWSAEIFGVVPAEGSDPTEVKDFKYWGLHPIAAVAILIAVERMSGAAMKAKEESKP